MLSHPQIQSEKCVLILSDLLVLSIGLLEFDVSTDEPLLVPFGLVLDLILEGPLLLTDQKQLVLHAVTGLRECRIEVLQHHLVQRLKW